MRISAEQISIIKDTIGRIVPLEDFDKLALFGSRTDDSKRGGDVDLLLVLRQPVARPSYLRAKLASQIERQFEANLGGALKVDVLLQAPNIAMQPIHHVAAQGIWL